MAAIPLPVALTRAADWFNDAMLARLQNEGYPRLNRSQALVLTALEDGGMHPAELARRLGMTRQSMQQLVGLLDAFGLVRLTPRPDDRRSKAVTLTALGSDAAHAARKHARALERELTKRIGRDNVEALRLALSTEWGDAPHPL